MRGLLLTFLALTGCASVSPTPGNAAGFGQVVDVEGIRVRPLSLIEDSRCPATVRCIWAGRVRILAEINHVGGSEELRIEMTLGEPLAISEGKLTLRAVQPAKVKLKPIDASDYRFTFDLVH